MSITALPTAPSRDMAPSTFITTADAWVASLATFTTEANALQSDVNAKENTATTAASTATTKAAEALSSANTTIAAKDIAVAAKDDAVAAQQAAEAIIEQALIDGPVLSVNGDTGVVVVTPASISAQPVMQQASQAEAEAGTSTQTRLWTPQRVHQAITAWWGTITQNAVRTKAGIGTNAEGNRTVSTGDPVGGSDKDVWYKV